MKLLQASLLVGAASAALLPESQKPFLSDVQDVFNDYKSEAADLLSHLRSKVPDFAEELVEKLETSQTTAEILEFVKSNEKMLDDVKSGFLGKPKPATRRPDSHWDHIVRGSDIQNDWVRTSSGEKARRIDGKLEDFDLRVKAVDTSKLGIDRDVKQFSGYLDDNKEDKHLFYWFFESRNDPKNDPVVLWLNGGPGCSSLTGMLYELGPAFTNKKIENDFNPYSWTNNASVIFLDQPVNVGFSYSSGSVSNTVAAGKDVYALMTLFFEQFPEYAKQPFHIAGESYGGHYIPVFAHEILSHKNRNINLQSILIGNGLTDGLTQYAYYRPMACGDGGYPAVLEESECQAMDNALPRCQSLIQACYDSESTWSCVPAAIYCNNAMIGPYQRTGTNVYDIRGPCKDTSNLCYPEMGYIQQWLNQKDVMKALGAEVSNYESCNFDINRNFLFAGDWMKPFHRLLPDIIAEIPVLIYAGDSDFICNHLGNKAYLEELEWPGQKAYNNAEDQKLHLAGSGKHIGDFKTSGNLTWTRLFQGGHMIPRDQPEASLEMFNRWIMRDDFSA